MEVPHMWSHAVLAVLLATHFAGRLLVLPVVPFLVNFHVEEVLATDVAQLRLGLLVSLPVLM